MLAVFFSLPPKLQAASINTLVVSLEQEFLNVVKNCIPVADPQIAFRGSADPICRHAFSKNSILAFVIFSKKYVP